MPKKMHLIEWSGVVTGVIAYFLIALNISAEVWGFISLLLSSLLIGIWAFTLRHNGIFILQIFYASVAVIGIVRWL